MGIETKNGREIQNSQRPETLSQFFYRDKKGDFFKSQVQKNDKTFLKCLIMLFSLYGR